RICACDVAITAETLRDLRAADWANLHQGLSQAARTRAQQLVQPTSGGSVLVCPVSAGPEILGFVLADTRGRRPDSVDQAAADSAALIAAAQFLRERALQEGEIHRRGYLLDQMLSGETTGVGAELDMLSPPITR